MKKIKLKTLCIGGTQEEKSRLAEKWEEVKASFEADALKLVPEKVVVIHTKKAFEDLIDNLSLCAESYKAYTFTDGATNATVRFDVQKTFGSLFDYESDENYKLPFSLTLRCRALKKQFVFSFVMHFC